MDDGRRCREEGWPTEEAKGEERRREKTKKGRLMERKLLDSGLHASLPRCSCSGAQLSVDRVLVNESNRKQPADERARRTTRKRGKREERNRTTGSRGSEVHEKKVNRCSAPLVRTTVRARRRGALSIFKRRLRREAKGENLTIFFLFLVRYTRKVMSAAVETPADLQSPPLTRRRPSQVLSSYVNFPQLFAVSSALLRFRETGEHGQVADSSFSHPVTTTSMSGSALFSSVALPPLSSRLAAPALRTPSRR